MISQSDGNTTLNFKYNAFGEQIVTSKDISGEDDDLVLISNQINITNGRLESTTNKNLDDLTDLKTSYGYDIYGRVSATIMDTHLGGQEIGVTNFDGATDRVIQNQRYLPGASATTQYVYDHSKRCLLYTSPSPRDRQKSRMPSSA